MTMMLPLSRGEDGSVDALALPVSVYERRSRDNHCQHKVASCYLTDSGEQALPDPLLLGIFSVLLHRVGRRIGGV
jgi:hypothetical protein